MQRLLLQLVEHFVAHGHRLDVDRAVVVERERGDAAEGGDVLVLLADRLAEALDLEVAGLLGELAARAEARACTCGAR